jgi:quinohemoprotein ethanol dehydrogenase
VFVGVTDGRLLALNAETGTLLWFVQTTPPNERYSITIAPRVMKGKVIIGNSGGESPVRGFVSAYDADNGKLAWRFYTVPGDPAKGFENDAMRRAAATWSGTWYKLGGGGNVWDAMAYDPDLNLVYFGTANGGPWPEQLRQSQGKDNLYIASVLALNADSGAYKWHYQFTPGDSWDYDATSQLTLVDLRIRGQVRKVIMQANKNGFFYVLDRTNGRFISAQPFAAVNWASGIDQNTGKPRINPEARYGAQSICIWDPVAQTERWSDFGSGFVDGGALSTAGGLVFQTGHLYNTAGTVSRFSAYDAKDGRKLLDLTLPNTAGLGPPMTYLLDGKQYIALAAANSTSTLRYLPRLYVFTLDGKAPLP